MWGYSWARSIHSRHSLERTRRLRRKLVAHLRTRQGLEFPEVDILPTSSTSVLRFPILACPPVSPSSAKSSLARLPTYIGKRSDLLYSKEEEQANAGTTPRGSAK